MAFEGIASNHHEDPAMFNKVSQRPDEDRLRAFDYLLFCVWAALPFAIFFYVRG